MSTGPTIDEIEEVRLRLKSVPRQGRSKDIRAASRTGTIRINTFRYTDVRFPWGETRDSGVGQEHGITAIETFIEPKAVWMNLNLYGNSAARFGGN